MSNLTPMTYVISTPVDYIKLSSHQLHLLSE